MFFFPGDKGESLGCSGPVGDRGPPGDDGPSGDFQVLVLWTLKPATREHKLV